MKRVTLICAAALFVAANAFAQKWQKGYTVFPGGDTLRGLIQKPPKSAPPINQLILFRVSMDSTPVAFRPFAVRSFCIAGNLYQSVVTFKSIMPAHFKAAAGILSNVVNETEEAENTRLKQEGHYVAYKGVGSSQTISGVPDSYSASVTLPPQCSVFQPDSSFALVLLSSSYLRCYELEGKEPTYFVGTGDNDEALQLCYFMPEVDGRTWEVKSYRVQLWGILKPVIQAQYTPDTPDLQQMIASARYNWKDISRILQKANRILGGKILHAIK